jgi:hypothetical protein
MARKKTGDEIISDGEGLEPRGADADLASTALPQAGSAARSTTDRGTMIPARSHRSLIESFFMRIVATAGIVGIGVAIAAIMQSSHSHGWLIGLVVSIVSVILAAVLWSARRL